jgi:hypothetical protein
VEELKNELALVAKLKHRNLHKKISLNVLQLQSCKKGTYLSTPSDQHCHIIGGLLLLGHLSLKQKL